MHCPFPARMTLSYPYHHSHVALAQSWMILKHISMVAWLSLSNALAPPLCPFLISQHFGGLWVESRKRQWPGRELSGFKRALQKQPGDVTVWFVEHIISSKCLLFSPLIFGIKFVKMQDTLPSIAHLCWVSDNHIQRVYIYIYIYILPLPLQ